MKKISDADGIFRDVMDFLYDRIPAPKNPRICNMKKSQD